MSLYKRNGVYYTRFYGPPDSTGHRPQTNRSCKTEKKKDALTVEAEIMDEVFSRTKPTVNPELRLEQYMTEWLQKAKEALSPTTIDKYGMNARNHIYPNLGQYRLSELTPKTIQDFLGNLRRKSKIGPRKLGAKSAHNIHGLLSVCLKEAYRLYYITENPMDRVKAPRVPRKEMKIATVLDLAKLLRAVEGWKYRIPVLVAAYTGARSGEALALQWNEINFETGCLTIRHNLIQIPKYVGLKPTKSDNVRDVKMDLDLQQVFLEERERQKTVGLNTELVGCNKDGGFLTPGGINRAFGRLAKDHGIDIRMHGLRHTQATALMEADIQPAIVRDRLGHSVSSFTQDRYQHPKAHMQDSSVQAIHDLIEKARNLKLEGDGQQSAEPGG